MAKWQWQNGNGKVAMAMKKKLKLDCFSPAWTNFSPAWTSACPTWNFKVKLISVQPDKPLSNLESKFLKIHQKCTQSKKYCKTDLICLNLIYNLNFGHWKNWGHHHQPWLASFDRDLPIFGPRMTIFGAWLTNFWQSQAIFGCNLQFMSYDQQFWGTIRNFWSRIATLVQKKE